MIRALYSLMVYVARPLGFAVVLWRGLRNPAYRQGWRERFGFGARSADAVLWVHAVSVGEVAAAAAVVRALNERYPGAPLLLTTATPTGRARAQALVGAAQVRYLPYDTPGGMRRFMRRVRPRIAIIMETELWPNLFAACRRRGVPVVLASARLSAKSVARYRRFGALFRPLFGGDTLVAAQSAEDAGRFIAIGARPELTAVTGNVKFDLRVDEAVLSQGRDFAAAWSGRPVWIAGSTHAGEEEAVLTAHAELLEAHPDAVLLLAPRHPERFAGVADLLARRGLRFERRSSSSGLGPQGSLPPDAQVLLVDTLGELPAFYAAADIAFVGGSLVPVGGHNLLEPAALGVPVLTGPHQANNREIARWLLAAGGAFEVADAAQLAGTVRALFEDPPRRRQAGASARAVVEANRGSVARLLTLMEPFLSAAC